MPIAFLTAAFLTGTLAFCCWLLSGGSYVGGAVAYALSGNLALAGLAARVSKARPR